jgi:dTDP-glucose pyrophosphorylase
MHINDFKKGWFLGRFEPSLSQTDYEVGLRWNNAGDQEDRHFHKQVTEYVVFAGGLHRLNDVLYEDGDMTVIHPYQSTDYECISDGCCLTVKDKSLPNDKYLGKPINLVVPMAGRGQRFIDAGFTTPKPLIDIQGKPMITRVVENFTPKADHRTILVTRKDIKLDIDATIVPLDHETEGAVSTMFEIEHLIGPEDPLLIVNCDQLILNFDVDDFIEKALSCSVAVFKCDNPHHSYVEVRDNVIYDVAEKKVISDLAVAGVYFYRQSKFFFDNAHKMVDNNIRVNGEFYVTPVFKKIICAGLKSNVYEVPVKDQCILGTPKELKAFQERGIKLKS